MDKTATHNDLTCVFTEADHSYCIQSTGDLLTSVTTLIKRVTPPFNAPAMAQLMIDKKKPKYADMNIEEIIQSWQNYSAITSNDGNITHEYLEQWLEKKGYGFHPRTIRALNMCKQIDKLYPKLLERFRFVEAEKLVFSARMGIAGQIDLLMVDDSTNQGIILDLKTKTKTLTDEDSAFGNLLPPVEHLKNCDVVKYGLQLALYEKILEEEDYYSEFLGYRKALLHIRPRIGRVVKVRGYNEEIEKILTEATC